MTSSKHVGNDMEITEVLEALFQTQARNHEVIRWMIEDAMSAKQVFLRQAKLADAGLAITRNQVWFAGEVRSICRLWGDAGVKRLLGSETGRSAATDV